MAVFIGKGLWHLIDIILRPLLFTFIWWSLYLPKASMWGYIW